MLSFLLNLKNALKAAWLSSFAIKEFETRENLALTEEMVTIISASAIQLSFGLRDFRYRYFKKIIIYPEQFYSNAGKAMHLGETNMRGTIVFSWKDFVKGYAITDDNLNLGLHEFSHALFINYLKGKKNDLHFDGAYDQWKQEGSRQFFHLKKESSTYLRSYAETNLMEFFAVSVECFFETPQLLIQYHPNIYKSLKHLLRQDPILLEELKN